MTSILAATLKAPLQPVYERLVCSNPSCDQQQWSFRSGTVERITALNKPDTFPGTVSSGSLFSKIQPNNKE